MSLNTIIFSRVTNISPDMHHVTGRIPLQWKRHWYISHLTFRDLCEDKLLIVQYTYTHGTYSCATRILIYIHGTYSCATRILIYIHGTYSCATRILIYIHGTYSCATRILIYIHGTYSCATRILILSLTWTEICENKRKNFYYVIQLLLY